MTRRRPLDRDELVRMAARNNAEWCDAFCRSHGLRGRFDAQTWTSFRRTPPLHPDAVTLTATASVPQVLARIDTSPGCTVKDSFACLDLAPAGFEILLEARWIHRLAKHRLAPPPPRVRWAPIRDPDSLQAWEGAWSDGCVPAGLFPSDLLADESVLVLAGWTGSRIVAGAVVNSSAAAVGISNLFASDGDLDRAWAGALAATAQHFPHSPVVGYERGESLEAAIRQGCTALGPLRVWTPGD